MLFKPVRTLLYHNLIGLMLSCEILCYVCLPCVALGWSVICDRSFPGLLTYFLDNIIRRKSLMDKGEEISI